MVLAGSGVATADILAFSVGMEAAILIFNLGLGMFCMARLLGRWNFREAIRESREANAPKRADAAPPVDGSQSLP